MQDVTAGRSAAAPHNDQLDPTRPDRRLAHTVVEDVTAGRSAGTAWNTAQDPTRPATLADPRR